jgi:hypothetical protein
MFSRRTTPAAGACFAGHEGSVSTIKIVGDEQSRPLSPDLSRGRLNCRGQMVCFLMFFVTCLSLGYQTLWRYDPRRHPALAEFSFCDPHSYYCMVQSDYSRALAPYRFRILGPGLASLVYHALPPGKIGQADPVYFSLLLVNSVVMALACLAIMRLGQQSGQSLAAGCIGAFFYLASWCVANLTLGGVYIDSFEILILSTLMIVVMASAWQWTPLLLAVAVMAKETTVIFGLSLMLAVIVDAWLSRRKVPRAWLGWWLLSVIVGITVLYAVHAIVGGDQREDQTFSWRRLAGMLYGYRMFLHHTFFIAIGPLAALSVFRLHRLPRPMLAASLALSIASILASAYVGAGGDVGRILCNTVGPVLALSGGIFICDLLRDRPADRAQSEKSAVRTGIFPERIADLRGAAPSAPSRRRAA